MAILFFDTETSGLPNKNIGISDESQPHIIQLAATLCTEKLIPILSLNALIKPNGWAISEFITKLTGISENRLNEEGISEKSALNLFLMMVNKSRLLVAHNIYFDNQIIQIGASRYGLIFPEKKMFCTMSESKNILAIPPTEKMVQAGFDSFKNPNLSECIKFFFNEDFNGEHDASNDVNACLRVYRKILEIEKREIV